MEWASTAFDGMLRKKKFKSAAKCQFCSTFFSFAERTLGAQTVFFGQSDRSTIVEGPNANLVLLEIKHTQGSLEGDALKQMQDNFTLFNAGKVARIEYIFSTEDGAIDNKPNFLSFATANPLAIKVFFIKGDKTKGHTKEPLKILN